MSLGLVACVGGIDSGGPSGDDGTTETARQQFDQNVYPIIGACMSCHTTGHPSGNVTGFYDPNAATAYVTATSYTALVGQFDPSTAPILTKILPGNHNGQAYSSDQVTKITNWLNKELAERTGSTAPPTSPDSPAAAMQRTIKTFAGCMQLTDFQIAKMATDLGNMQSQNPQDNCHSCHENAEYGFENNNVESQFYTTISSHSRLLLMYFSVDTTGGVSNYKMQINTTPFMMVGAAKYPFNDHPQFDYTTITTNQSLVDFFNATQARVTSLGASCGGMPLVD
jgi:hypothetical protein